MRDKSKKSFDNQPDFLYFCKKIINHKSDIIHQIMKIKAYGKGELAQLYCPNITTAAARKKLMLWINYYPHLMDDLRSIGYLDATRSFTPAQVRLIIEALGEP